MAADKGEPVDGRRNTYSDGEYEWFNIRIPKHANAEPEFKNYELRWPLCLHAEGVGWTGWDWRARRSRAWGFDFDSLVAHAKGIGISDEELERVKQAAMAWPLFEVRKSTGGSGIHLYIYTDEEGIETENHTIHSALGRCLLGMASSETGFDFASQIDAAGGNMWFWHRKMTPENEGLKLLKAAERTISAADLPANWRDHVEVIKRRRAKVRVNGIADDALDPFEALTSSRPIVPLDATHKQIIEELQHSGFTTLWVPDHHLCQTHTKALEKIAEKYQGVLRTNSRGNNPGTPNCFMFPLEKGGWRVYRFSPGVQEDETWTQDGEGWTNCYFNKKPNLATAAKAMGGIEDEKGGFVFKTLTDAKKAAQLVGEKITVEGFDQRKTTLKTHKDGRLIVQIERSDGDAPLRGYLEKSKQFVKVCNTIAKDTKEEPGCVLDKIIRHIITANGADAGWLVQRDSGWGHESYTNSKILLQNSGLSSTDAEIMLGGAVKRAWKLVNLPFQPEYPGGRLWNYEAAQFRYQPIVLADDETPHHPHWDLIFNHAFDSLTPILKTLPWAKEAKITLGGDYGRYWVACMLRDPFEPLPYLFFYGPENSGKSIIHEGISLLMTAGVVRADRALSTKGDFNGELANAILAVIEEQQIANHPGAIAKIRDWVTTRTLSIRRMRTDSYEQPSTLHFMQFSNWFHAVPIFPGDTRAMVIEVPPFKGKEIPKMELLAELTKEAPHFLRTIMDMELPAPMDRLRLPFVETADKAELADETAPVNRFVKECCKVGPTHKTIKVQLLGAYNRWARDNGFEEMVITEFGKQLMAVSKNQIRPRGQKKDQDGRKKHCYEGVSLTNAV